MSTKIVRTRFAPSPTGYLHVGGLRTALYSYLYAKKHGGKFILRIEDTDQTRKVEGAVEALIEIMHKVGLSYDEGPFIEKGEIKEHGKYGPYIQSQRLGIYKQYANQLLKEGKAYYSFKTAEELEVLRADLIKTNTPLKRHHLNENYSLEEAENLIAKGKKAVIRFQTPTSGKIKHHDLVRGDVEFDLATLDDFVILKSDGYPVYHLASVVDDSEMKISHVIRAEEWLPSVPKHILIYEALGFPKPEFAHIPLILNPDKSKLSKRQGDVAVEDYLKKGYLPETLINFIALLGWNPGEGSTKEIFNIKELIKAFDLGKVNKAGAVFDIKKLNWMNAEYLRSIYGIKDYLEIPEVKIKFDEYLIESKIGQNILHDKNKKLLLGEISRQHIEFLGQLDEFFQANNWLSDEIKINAPLAWKKSTLEDAKGKISELVGLVESLKEKFFTPAELEKAIKAWITEKNYGLGDVLWPMRVALTGQEKSPNPFEVASLLGKEETILRLKNAIEKSK